MRNNILYIGIIGIAGIILLLKMTSTSFVNLTNILTPSQQRQVVRDPAHPDEHFNINTAEYNVKSPVTTMSDTITIVRNTGKKVPEGDNNDLVYYFAAHTANSPTALAELDIISDSVSNYFMTVYLGKTLHKMIMPVVVGHRYKRTIQILANNRIVFTLTDLTTGQTEQFTQPVSSINNISSLAQGIEYHTTKGKFDRNFDVSVTTPITA